MNLKLERAWISGLAQDFYVNNHCHEFLEIICFVSGCGTTNVAGTHYEISRNSIAVIPAKVIHDQKNASEVKSICLLATGSGLEDYCGLWSDDSGVIRKLSENLMLEYARRERTGAAYIIDGLLAQVVGHCHRLIEAGGRRTVHESAMASALAMIQENNGNVSVQELASSLFMSQDNFRRQFRELNGMSPMQAIIKARIDHAMDLMNSDEKLSISAIAYQCGFDSPFYFSRLFRKVTGKSPSDFIKD